MTTLQEINQSINQQHNYRDIPRIVRSSVPSVKVACFPTLKTSDLDDGGSGGSALEAEEPSAKGLTMALWLPIVIVLINDGLEAFYRQGGRDKRE